MPSYSFRNPLRRKLKAGETAYGLWVTLETPTVTEVAGEMGLDWVCIELEHGSLDYRDVLSHLRAAKGTNMGRHSPQCNRKSLPRRQNKL